MLDPTSLVFIVTFSLAVTPALVFIAYVYMLKRSQSSIAFYQRLRSLKFRIILSIVTGIKLALIFYLLILWLARDDMGITSPSGILIRVVAFTGLSSLGTYLGTTAASKIVGPTENAGVPES